MKSQHYKNKWSLGRAWCPTDIDEWRTVCRGAPYDTQFAKHYDVKEATVRAFFDREYSKQENDPTYTSTWLAIYKEERQKVRTLITDALLNSVQKGELTGIIYASKVFNGYLEAKDKAHIELKRQELILKNKDYLTQLALRFSLSMDQLEEFTKKFFPDIKLLGN